MTTAEKRRVLITGASSGIGLEAAKILLARGDALTVLCRNAERADATRAALSDSVQTCIGFDPRVPGGGYSASRALAPLERGQDLSRHY